MDRHHGERFKVIRYLYLITVSLCMCVPVKASATSIQVYFISGERTVHANTAMEIPASAQQIIFRVGDTAWDFNSHSGRVRYRLEGVDSDWHQRTETMCLRVYFYNSIGDRIGEEAYSVTGKSSGWNNNVETSTFSHRHEIVTVPPGANHFSVCISSAGPLTAVGVYAVKDILITTQPHTANEVSTTILDSRPFLHEDSGNAIPSHAEWIRNGDHPSMATIITMSSLDKAFCIIDNDSTSYAEWTSLWQHAPQVIPGEHLTVDWNEAYDTGMANKFEAAYKIPPFGRYRLTVQEVDAFDHPLRSVNTVEIAVLPPAWKNPWVWGFCFIGTVLIAFLGDRYRRFSQARLQHQRKRLVEQERQRIARDLHDDLGARLTHISLISSFAASKASSDDSNASFIEISTMSREMISTLSDVIWTINPKNDHLESMVHYLCQIIGRLCQSAAVKCHIEESIDNSERPVSSNVRHHVILAVKESINNVFKHSDTTELHVKIHFHDSILTILIIDNGKGFSDVPNEKGNGIVNMKKRMTLINGKMNMKSILGKGTTVLFEIPIC